jgi:hypothetical protein
MPLPSCSNAQLYAYNNHVDIAPALPIAISLKKPAAHSKISLVWHPMVFKSCLPTFPGDKCKTASRDTNSS